MMKNGKTIVEVDTAKSVFQLYRVELETGKSMALKLRRAAARSTGRVGYGSWATRRGRFRRRW